MSWADGPVLCCMTMNLYWKDSAGMSCVINIILMKSTSNNFVFHSTDAGIFMSISSIFSLYFAFLFWAEELLLQHLQPLWILWQTVAGTMLSQQGIVYMLPVYITLYFCSQVVAYPSSFLQMRLLSVGPGSYAFFGLCVSQHHSELPLPEAACRLM